MPRGVTTGPAEFNDGARAGPFGVEWEAVRRGGSERADVGGPFRLKTTGRTRGKRAATTLRREWPPS